MGTVPISRVGHRDDAVAGIERRHGHAELARLGQRVAQRLFVLEPAAAQHVLLRGHAMLGRGVEKLLADAADDFDGLRIAAVHDARHGQRRHVDELDLHAPRRAPRPRARCAR